MAGRRVVRACGPLFVHHGLPPTPSAAGLRRVGPRRVVWRRRVAIQLAYVLSLLASFRRRGPAAAGALSARERPRPQVLQQSHRAARALLGGRRARARRGASTIRVEPAGAPRRVLVRSHGGAATRSPSIPWRHRDAFLLRIRGCATTRPRSISWCLRDAFSLEPAAAPRRVLLRSRGGAATRPRSRR